MGYVEEQGYLAGTRGVTMKIKKINENGSLEFSFVKCYILVFSFFLMSITIDFLLSTQHMINLIFYFCIKFGKIRLINFMK